MLGCEALLGLIQSTTVTVTLVNQSSNFSVETAVIYDENELPREILVQDGFGIQRDDAIAAGASASFTLSCNDVESLLLEDADLQVLGGLGPDVEGDVLTQGDDFQCGDEIIYTFTHSAIIVDFNVTVDVQPGALGSILP